MRSEEYTSRDGVVSGNGYTAAPPSMRDAQHFKHSRLRPSSLLCPTSLACSGLLLKPVSHHPNPLHPNFFTHARVSNPSHSLNFTPLLAWSPLLPWSPPPHLVRLVGVLALVLRHVGVSPGEVGEEFARQVGDGVPRPEHDAHVELVRLQGCGREKCVCACVCMCVCAEEWCVRVRGAFVELVGL